MTDTMSITKEKEVTLWDETNSTELKMKSENNGESEGCDIITSINDLKEPVLSTDITGKKKVSGIYKIVNKVNGKYYVGSSIDVKKRWREHVSDLQRGNHKNRHLQRSWNKYGKDNFTFVFVEQTLDILSAEQKYLTIAHGELFKTYNMCWNAKAFWRGRKHTTQAKIKISKANIGRILSLETRNKIRQSKLGEKHPYFGKHLPKSHRIKIGKAVKGKLNPSYNPTIYTFYNIETKAMMNGTYYDFYTKFNFNRSGVGKLIHKKTNMYKHWIII